VASTQYLILYVLITPFAAFIALIPTFACALKYAQRTGDRHALIRDPELALGVAAPYEPGHDLIYQNCSALEGCPADMLRTHAEHVELDRPIGANRF